MIKLATKTLLIASVSCMGALFTASAWSEVAVIVHPSNGATMSATDISRIFLGKSKSYPGGGKALPVDQQEGSSVRSSFVSTVLKKNDQQIKAYWAQLLFTGKGTPPKEVGDDAAVKELVSGNPSVIGYIDASSVDGTVKVVHKF